MSFLRAIGYLLAIPFIIIGTTLLHLVLTIVYAFKGVNYWKMIDTYVQQKKKNTSL